MPAPQTHVTYTNAYESNTHSKGIRKFMVLQFKILDLKITFLLPLQNE